MIKFLLDILCALMPVRKWRHTIRLARKQRSYWPRFMFPWFGVANNTAIFMIDGGLGSQINQFIIGQFIAKNSNWNIKYDISWFKKHGKSIDGKENRNFDLLNVFPGLNLSIASPREIKFLKSNRYYKNNFVFVFDEGLFKRKSPIYIDGYYMNWRYFQDLNFARFKFSEDIITHNKPQVEFISSFENSVAVHVRRGDYLNSIFDILDETYFIKAIEVMIRQLQPSPVHFFFFSNDAQWVQENILNKIKITNATLMADNDNDAGYNDLYLMAHCRHQICSNSTFSYTASFLNQYNQKVVIIPKRWMNSDDRYHQHNEGSMDYPGYISL